MRFITFHTKLHLSLIVLIIAILIFACSNQQSDNVLNHQYKIVQMKDSEAQIFIEIPVGENSIFQLNENYRLDSIGDFEFLPSPVNIGFMPFFQETEIARFPAILLAIRLGYGKQIPTEIIGSFSYEVASQLEEYLLMVPTNHSISIVPDLSFTDFITIYDPIKFQLQNWFSQRYGLGKVSNFRWHDRDATFERLETLGLSNEFTE